MAPGEDLRKWFNHDRAKWRDFNNRYFSELSAKPEIVVIILDQAVKEHLTLLFSARDVECNQVVALRQYLLSELEKRLNNQVI